YHPRCRNYCITVHKAPGIPAGRHPEDTIIGAGRVGASARTNLSGRPFVMGDNRMAWELPCANQVVKGSWCLYKMIVGEQECWSGEGSFA
ncbi:hypothetical protein BP00DRAFT_352338, partial [Aspergillus indologenus CBS 114.80]